jgi:hypothetical protein
MKTVFVSVVVHHSSVVVHRSSVAVHPSSVVVHLSSVVVHRSSVVVHRSNLKVQPNVVFIFVLQRVTSRSLAALQQRRQQIISQLEKVVGKSAASAISSSAGSQARVVRTVLIANTVIALTE